MSYYLWKYLKSGGDQWIPIGWVVAAWDKSRHEWSDITGALLSQPAGEEAWWYAWPNPAQPNSGPRQGMYENANDGHRIVLEGQWA